MRDQSESPRCNTNRLDIIGLSTHVRLKFICMDTMATYYCAFVPHPELKGKATSYRGPPARSIKSNIA